MRYMLSLILVLILAFPAYAAFSGPGTAVGVNTVAQAKGASDDAPCVITGNIIMKVTGGDEKYIFKDSTGQITVEIDDELFVGRDITPDTKIRITGEVDKDMMKDAEIDVQFFEIIE